MKTNYDKFCEKLVTYVMKEFKGGENVIDILKDPGTDVMDTFKNASKPPDLTEDKKNQELK